MICKNCGFHNEKGDEFCGSCGQFLEWTGVVAEEAPAEPPTTTTAGEPTTREVPSGGEPPSGPPTGRPTGKPIELPAGAGGARSGAGAGPIAGTAGATSADGTEPVATPTVRPAGQPDVICWNCKTRNRAGRSFCLKCGERLSTGGGGGRGRLVAILLGIGALVLLAAGAAVFFLGGAPAPTPTPTPSPLPVTPTSSPSARPTTSPSQSPAAIDCATSAEPVRTVEFNRNNPERRSGQATAWCIRDVTFVARRGSGVLHLQLTNPTAFPDAPNGTVDWLMARMPEDFADADEYHPPITFPNSLQLVPAGTTITLVIECSTDPCNGRAHIAYDRVAAP